MWGSMDSHLKVFEALADPTRLKILSLLSKRGELCVCHIFESLDMSQPRVSRHLAILRTAKLVSTRRNGRWIYYSLAPNHLRAANTAIGGILQAADTTALRPPPVVECEPEGAPEAASPTAAEVK